MIANSRFTTDNSAATVQFVARILFACLAMAYFYNTDALFFAISAHTTWAIFASYLAAHIALLVLRPRHTDIIASMIDLVTLGGMILLDPGTPPPTMALLFIVVLSGGLLYGLQRFILMLIGSELMLLVALPIRFSHPDSPDGVGSVFLAAALTTCMLYFGFMIWRNQGLAKAALEATWRDPDTDFISREALISTAGWLIPLHDRISSPLTLVLIQHDELSLLSDRVAQRIRRSDVAARYNENHLALLLPCTASAASEQLLNDLRDRHPGLRAALMTLSSADVALEQALAHLENSMARTQQDDEHWLAHAPALH